MIIFIILCIAFVLYLFNKDKKDEKINVLQRGGMTSLYPNFIQYISQASNTDDSFLNFDTANFEMVKNDGEYLEYKFPITHNDKTYGYYFIGIQHCFATYAYCYCKNKNGRKIEGFMSEIHNGRDKTRLRDRPVEGYRGIFFNLVKQMENLPNFEEKFYFNSF